MSNGNKNHILFAKVNVMILSAKFQLLMVSEEMIFDYFFREFILSVAMTTNQIQQFGQNSYV